MEKQQQQQQHLDVVVVGAGIMGSCAAYETAKQGKTTLLLEQFDFLHHLGSSHGHSRTFRSTYPEPYYASMALRAFRLWEEAQAEAGYRVHIPTPQFDLGPADSKSLKLVVENCRANGVPVRVLGREEVRTEFSGVFELPEGWIGVVTEMGGVLGPTKAVAMFQSLAFRRGAVLKDHVKVTGISRDHTSGAGVIITTASGETFHSKKCIITAGAWTQKLLKLTTLPIEPLHTTVSYWKTLPTTAASFIPTSGFPTFACYNSPYIYGGPSTDFPGLVKIALHGGHKCDPDARRWDTNKASLEKELKPWIEKVMPGTVEVEKGAVVTQPCLYSMTPDGDFVVDYVGGELGEDVVVAGGFSGHGFKMGPVVGRVVAGMVGGEREEGLDLEVFGIGRFGGGRLGNAKEFEEAVTASEDGDIGI